MSKTYTIGTVSTSPVEIARYMARGTDIYNMHNPYWKKVIARLCYFIKLNIENMSDPIELRVKLHDGFDYAFAEAAILAKRHYTERIKLVILADNQCDTKMTKINKIIMQSADSVQDTKTAKANDLTIAFWNKRPFGNTFKCVRSCQLNGQAMYYLDPWSIIAKKRL